MKTTREALGVPSEWLAQTVGVTVRTVRHWESGRTRVPDDVALLLDALLGQVREHALATATRELSPPVNLLRFRDQEALRRATGLTWPVATHAIAQLRVLEQLRERGTQVRLVWFNDTDCVTWASTRPAASPDEWARAQAWDPAP